MQPPPARRHLILMGGSVRSATESAARDGWAVSAIDLFGDFDTRRSANSWHLLPSAADFDPLVAPLLGQLPDGPLILTGGMEQWYERLDKVRPTRPVLAPSTYAVDRLRDPAFLQRLAHESGLQFPRWSRPHSMGIPPGWLVKSRRSTAGLSVSTALSGPPGADDYFQQRVAGRPLGASFLATAAGTQFLGVARSLTRSVGQHPFLYSGSIGPVNLGAADLGAAAIGRENHHKLLRLADTVREQLDLRGLFGVDLIADRGGETLWLLEINPRVTASMELFEAAEGPSLITRHADAYGFTTDVGSRSAAWQSASIAAELPVRLKRIVWSREAFRWDPAWQEEAVHKGTSVETTSVVLRDIPLPNSRVDRGQPVVSICVAGRSMRACLRSAHKVETRLHRSIAAAK